MVRLSIGFRVTTAKQCRGPPHQWLALYIQTLAKYLTSGISVLKTITAPLGLLLQLLALRKLSHAGPCGVRHSSFFVKECASKHSYAFNLQLQLKRFTALVSAVSAWWHLTASTMTFLLRWASCMYTYESLAWHLEKGKSACWNVHFVQHHMKLQSTLYAPCLQRNLLADIGSNVA